MTEVDALNTLIRYVEMAWLPKKKHVLVEQAVSVLSKAISAKENVNGKTTKDEQRKGPRGRTAAGGGN